MDYNLRPIWDEILEIYKAFAAVCDKNGLRYYVTGGTLLGAARHKGFIPWDDDFDVVMPRPDYRKFFDICAKELPSHLRGYDFRTKLPSDNWHQMFGKVMEVRSEVVDSIANASNLMLNQGVFIDIIPIDGMPKATIPFYWWALRRSIWRHKKGSYQKDIQFEDWLMKWNYDKSPAVDDYNANGRRLKTRALSASSFGEPIMMPFDKIAVPCPQEWEKFLTLIYGEWRKLPPEDKCKPTHTMLNI